MRRRLARVASLALIAGGSATCGSNSAVEPESSTTPVPLTQLVGGNYLGFPGGLYPDGNNPPAAHATRGLADAAAIVPRDANGTPAPAGKYVLLSIGMSNTTQEFCGQGGGGTCAAWTFAGQAAADPVVNHATLVVANGAAGGRSASYWDSPGDPDYDRVRDQVLTPMGVTEAQVQIAWVKVANPGPTVSLPGLDADAYLLLRQMGDIARATRQRYPNMRQIFFSSRTFGGYATTVLNPEPYAYESGLGVKWVIEAQIRQGNGSGPDAIAGDLRYGSAPWLAWGPYLWGGPSNTPLGDITWVRADFGNDGTHPSASGAQKVGAALLAFFKNSAFTQCWFLAGRSCP